MLQFDMNIFEKYIYDILDFVGIYMRISDTLVYGKTSWYIIVLYHYALVSTAYSYVMYNSFISRITMFMSLTF